jgi:hypothetical protein
LAAIIEPSLARFASGPHQTAREVNGGKSAARRRSSGGLAPATRIVEMGLYRIVPVLFVLSLLFINGCSSQHHDETERHRHGAKVNVADFVRHTFAYKGKSITLALKVDEDGFPSNGRTLRDYAGKDILFTALDPKGQQTKLLIAIPIDVRIPDDVSDEVFVTFLCTQGHLRQGNKAQLIERSSGR